MVKIVVNSNLDKPEAKAYRKAAEAMAIIAVRSIEEAWDKRTKPGNVAPLPPGLKNLTEWATSKWRNPSKMAYPESDSSEQTEESVEQSYEQSADPAQHQTEPVQGEPLAQTAGTDASHPEEPEPFASETREETEDKQKALLSISNKNERTLIVAHDIGDWVRP